MIKWTPKVGQMILCTKDTCPSVYGQSGFGTGQSYTKGKRYEVIQQDDGLRVRDNMPYPDSSVLWYKDGSSGWAQEFFQDPQDIENSKEKNMRTGDWVVCVEGNKQFGLHIGDVFKVGEHYSNGNLEVFQAGRSRRVWEPRRFTPITLTPFPVIHQLESERYLAIGPKGVVEFTRKPHMSVWDSGMAALKTLEVPAMPEVCVGCGRLYLEIGKAIGHERRAIYTKKDGTKRDCKIKITSTDETKVYFVHVEQDGIRQVDLSQFNAIESADAKLLRVN